MYMVEIVYGMEHYQTERRGFLTEDEAVNFYEKKCKSKPLSIKLYALLAKGGIM
ncbi:hypothetical protein ACDN41_11920 [Priestia aryabhattai]|uniref:hypothetical protein n=1 Tax=Priestia aryabhattai TaxID=412384 RepID=UPI0035318A1C